MKHKVLDLTMVQRYPIECIHFGYTDSDPPTFEFKTKVGYGIEAYNTTGFRAIRKRQ